MISNLVSRRSESLVAPATGFGRVIPARVRPQTSQTCYHRNQQYSIVGLTNAAGTLVERYTYSAYGTLGIYAANGTIRSSSTYANRYTYTGREWDAELRLYHFRARWYDPATGGFVTRDPLGYVDGMNLYRGYFGVRGTDPNGTETRFDDQETAQVQDKDLVPIYTYSGSAGISVICGYRRRTPCEKFLRDYRTTYPKFSKLFECAQKKNCLPRGFEPLRCWTNCTSEQVAGYRYPFWPYTNYIYVCSTALDRSDFGPILEEEAYQALTLCYDGGTKVGKSLEEFEGQINSLNDKERSCASCVAREILALHCSRKSTPLYRLVGNALASCECEGIVPYLGRETMFSNKILALVKTWFDSGSPNKDCDFIDDECGAK